jgi:hypothetical protein
MFKCRFTIERIKRSNEKLKIIIVEWINVLPSKLMVIIFLESFLNIFLFRCQPSKAITLLAVFIYLK